MRVAAAFAVLMETTLLTRALLAVFFCAVKPMTQNGERLGFDLEESNARAEIGLHIDDFCFGLEEIFAGENFDEHQRVLREWIHHVEVAAVEA